MLQPTRQQNQDKTKKKASSGRFDAKSIVRMVIPLVVIVLIIIILINIMRSENSEATSKVASSLEDSTSVPKEDPVMSEQGGFDSISLSSQSDFKIDGSKFLFGHNIGCDEAKPLAEDMSIILGSYKVTPDKNCTYVLQDNQIDISHSKGVYLSIKRELVEDQITDGKDKFIAALKSGQATNLKTGVVFLDGKKCSTYVSGDVQVDNKSYNVRMMRISEAISETAEADNGQAISEEVYTLVGIAQEGAQDYLDMLYKNVEYVTWNGSVSYSHKLSFE